MQVHRMKRPAADDRLDTGTKISELCPGFKFSLASAGKFEQIFDAQIIRERQRIKMSGMGFDDHAQMHQLTKQQNRVVGLKTENALDGIYRGKDMPCRADGAHPGSDV